MSSLCCWAVKDGTATDKAPFAEVTGGKHPALRPIVINRRVGQWSFGGRSSSASLSKRVVQEQPGGVRRGGDKHRRQPSIKILVQVEASISADFSIPRSACDGTADAAEKEHAIGILIRGLAVPMNRSREKNGDDERRRDMIGCISRVRTTLRKT